MNDATTPPAVRSSGFLAAAAASPAAEQLFAADMNSYGYVMNLTRVWAHQPALRDGLSAVVDQAAAAAGLTMRDRGVLISAGASAVGDAYCSLAWGNRLAAVTGGEVAAGVIAGGDGGLDRRERALAAWARWVASDPNGVSAGDIDGLRDAGYADAEILAVTVFVALRMAFAAVNDALGAAPDHQLVEAATTPMRRAVNFGRHPADAP